MSCATFYDGDTFIHRLDPRPRIIVTVIFSILVALVSDLIVLFAGLAAGQCALDTPYVSGFSQDGNMFDIVCLNGNGITVTGFNCNLDFGFWDFEVYSCNLGSHVGNEQTPSNWTLLGTATQILGRGEGQPTRIPIPFSVSILPGQTQGFYVTCVDIPGTTTGINYTPGTAVGNVLAANDDLFTQMQKQLKRRSS